MAVPLICGMMKCSSVVAHHPGSGWAPGIWSTLVCLSFSFLFLLFLQLSSSSSSMQVVLYLRARRASATFVVPVFSIRTLRCSSVSPALPSRELLAELGSVFLVASSLSIAARRAQSPCLIHPSSPEVQDNGEAD